MPSMMILYGPSLRSYIQSLCAPATSSTDAVKIHPKRPMSRMEVPFGVFSKDNRLEAEDEEIGNEAHPSSAKTFSFELSNGHPYGPQVPTAMDDDKYVEYAFDGLAGFPCNVEEEERMFVEAVIESLKDLEMRHPHAEEPPPPGVSTESSESAQKDNFNASSTIEHCDTLKTESISTSVINGNNLASKHPSPGTSVSSMGLDTPPSFVESRSTGTSACTDTSVSTQSLSDADMSSNTKATLTIVRNPASHIMDGLIRSWDLSFFRNR